ncbi:MAG: hypothetical protein HOO06_06760 [Bdellovibrionaceae bacterium]|nr:hypothetical protein [Pseudobdellovibrionaceae bacterium]
MKPLIFLITFSFIIGVAWSLKRQEILETTEPDLFDDEVSILALRSQIPQTLLQEFQRLYKIKVNITYAKNDFELYKKSINSANKYDLIQLRLATINDLELHHLFTPFPKEKLEHLSKISPDFVQIKNLQKLKFIPISWEILGWAHNQKESPFKNLAQRDFLTTAKDKNTNFFLPKDPLELFRLLEKSDFVSPEWIRQQHEMKLSQALANALNKNKITPWDYENSIKISVLENMNKKRKKEKILIFPLSSSQFYSNNLADKKFQFSLWPYSSNTLKVNLFGLSKKASHIKPAIKFINFILEPQVNSQLTQLIFKNSVMDSNNHRKIPEYLKVKTLRDYKLSELKLVTEASGYSYIWEKVYNSLLEKHTAP